MRRSRQSATQRGGTWHLWCSRHLLFVGCFLALWELPQRWRAPAQRDNPSTTTPTTNPTLTFTPPPFRPQDEIADALERIIAGPEKKGAVMSEKKKRLVAYHEAGHALVSTAAAPPASPARRRHHLLRPGEPCAGLPLAAPRPPASSPAVSRHTPRPGCPAGGRAHARVRPRDQDLHRASRRRRRPHLLRTFRGASGVGPVQPVRCVGPCGPWVARAAVVAAMCRLPGCVPVAWRARPAVCAQPRASPLRQPATVLSGWMLYPMLTPSALRRGA